MGTALPASPSVPALEREGLNFMYVCYTTLCADDLQTVPVRAAECSGSAFWANHIFWKDHLQILKFNLSVTYLFFNGTDIFTL